MEQTPRAESAPTDKSEIILDAEPTEPAIEVVPPRRAARRLLRAETFYFMGLLAFAVLAFFAYSYAYFGWDVELQRKIRGIGLPGFGELMDATSMPGNYWYPYALTALTVLAFFLLRLRTEAISLALCVIGASTLNALFKTIVGRPRPTPEPGMMVREYMRNQSFPSGHVTFFVAYFGFLFFASYALLPRGSLARRIALTVTALPVLLIGLSRVYLYAHWPSDTLGSYLFGGLWLAFSLEMYRRWKERRTFHKAEAVNVQQ